MQNGHFKQTFLQAVPTAKMFRNWNAQGVHSDRGGEGEETAENRRKQVRQDVSHFHYTFTFVVLVCYLQLLAPN